MSDWWEQPYRGGPAVAAKYTRPLYPPDAAPGHTPSSDGPDVEATKRTVSRLGRWEWQKFDQAYSNGFAHGKPPGNVRETGMAGVQRQANIQPTGWMGENTFNMLRNVLVPDGLPHAGEHAMDARAVELFNAAYDMNLDQPPSGSSSAAARLAQAQTQLGITEQPAGSNLTKYGQWYGMNGQPWCAIFVTWCDQLSPNPSDSLVRSSRYAYVPFVVEDARIGNNGLSLTTSPKPGDLVCFDWDYNGEHDHIGIVMTPPDTSGNFQTVEGNTSTTDQSNGGQVMQRTRNRNHQATLFVHIKEP